MHPDCCEILFTEDMIAERVKELGAQISEDFKGEPILLIALLKGSVFFLADLARAIDGDVEIETITVSSYGNAAVSSGQVRISGDIATDMRDKHVILVEDIVDTGITLGYVTDILASRGALSIDVATLLVKKREKARALETRYVGFECEDAFVVGYGLDYAQRYRHLPYVGILDPKIYS